MADKTYKTISRFIGGISEFPREGTEKDMYAMGQSVDVRTDPQNITLLPRALKESGSVILDLPKWGEYISACDKTYIYDQSGNIYLRTNTPSYSLVHTVPNSHGNGLAWYGEDNFLYYTSDKLIGRYGPICSDSATFVDDFFGSQGGTPLNTNSLSISSASTQYAKRASSASLQITGNLSMELWIKPTSLPSSGQTMTLASKWTENGNIRSYKFGIGTASNYFGDGSDGALTVSVNTTDSPIDSACSGTSGSSTLTATNASFTAGQVILIIQSQGTNAGAWQKNKIQSYTAGTITLETPLNTTYSTGAQVVVLKQYTNVTINAGVTLTAKAWNGTTGGVLGFLANGTLSGGGAISADGKGFRGGASTTATASTGYQGEGTTGTSTTRSTAANGNGGGGGTGDTIGQNYSPAGGGGGGNGTTGTSGSRGAESSFTPGTGGVMSGSSDLTTITFGGGGGAGGNDTGASGPTASGAGGNGGGIIFLAVVTSSFTGTISSAGLAGGSNPSNPSASGGGGAGGSILIKSQVATLGTNLITALGGAGGTGSYGGNGGSGSAGRIHLDYLTSYTGTTNPTLDSTQDTTLGSSDGYTLFLSLSDNGTNVFTYSKPVNLLTGKWQNVAVAFDYGVTGSSSNVEFFLGGDSIGTVATSSLYTISSNASDFNIGCDLDSSSNPQHLFDGLIDETRIWAGVRTASDISPQLYQQINPASTGLQAYYQFNSVATDSTSNGNNLTLMNGATYSTDVPFASPTTRTDIDQSSSTSGNTYALKTTIGESTADKKTFTPAADPQKSLRVYISSLGAGSGSITVTIHDQYNNLLASKTVAKSALPSSGDYEFIFDSVWRPLTNFTNTYHFHITDTDGTATIRSSSSNDLSTVDFTTYYQYLVEETSFHPIARYQNFLVIGNERYLAKIDAGVYYPNYLVLPAGYHLWSFSYWNEYLAIGCIKGSTATEQDQGRIYFWDGSSKVPNFWVDVPQGGVTALTNMNGILLGFAGYQSHMIGYVGGTSAVYMGSGPIRSLRKVPYLESSSYTITYPGAVTVWKSLLRWGITGDSNSTNISRGVWTYGSTNYKYPEALTFDYPISTGNVKSTNVKIGLLIPVKQQLLVGWQDGTGYGIDNIDANNPCATYGYIDFMIDDGDVVWKEKNMFTLVAKTSSLTSGQTVNLRNKFDDMTTWNEGPTTSNSSSDPTISRLTLTTERFYESQYGINIYSTTGVSQSLKGLGIESSVNKSEGRV